MIGNIYDLVPNYKHINMRNQDVANRYKYI